MQMFSSSLFLVLVATSRGQRTHSEGKVQSFFARPPPQWELPLAPIGSGFSYQQLPLAERGERWPGRFSSSFWHVAVPVGRRQIACGEVPRGRARVQVSRCATDGDSFGGGSIGWRWVRPCRCAKTVTWEELGGWGRGERSPMTSWSVGVFGGKSEVRSVLAQLTFDRWDRSNLALGAGEACLFSSPEKLRWYSRKYLSTTWRASQYHKQ